MLSMLWIAEKKCHAGPDAMIHPMPERSEAASAKALHAGPAGDPNERRDPANELRLQERWSPMPGSIDSSSQSRPLGVSAQKVNALVPLGQGEKGLREETSRRATPRRSPSGERGKPKHVRPANLGWG